MKWILCNLLNTDNVSYLTDDSQEPRYMPYKKFKEFSRTLDIHPYNEFLDELNKYQPLLINCDTSKWEVYKQEIDPNVSFEKLLELNPNDKEILKPLTKRDWIRDFSKNDSIKNYKKKFDFLK